MVNTLKTGGVKGFLSDYFLDFFNLLDMSFLIVRKNLPPSHTQVILSTCWISWKITHFDQKS